MGFGITESPIPLVLLAVAAWREEQDPVAQHQALHAVGDDDEDRVAGGVVGHHAHAEPVALPGRQPRQGALAIHLQGA